MDSGYGLNIQLGIPTVDLALSLQLLAWVRSLAQKLPCAMGAAKKKKKKNYRIGFYSATSQQ